jgi:hypothetical protein
MSLPYIQANNASRERLETVARSLTAADLARKTPDGWSVAALLAHLAVMDRRHLILLRRWKAGGVDNSPLDADMLNDSLKPILSALDPQIALELCLATASEVDGELETVTPELYEQVTASPNWFRFNRGLHRTAHLDQIEQLLSSR